MYIDSYTKKNGTVVFRITYLNQNGKRVRLPQDKHPVFGSKAEAASWVKSQAAHDASMKARIERKLAWKNQYYEFDKLILQFKEWAKGRSPNSFDVLTGRTEQYVLPFFLNEKSCNNINQWVLYHQQFKDWLRAQTNKTGNPLAISSVNNCILAYNSFIDFMKDYNKIDPENAVKIKRYPEHMINQRGFEDIIQEEERDLVFEKMGAIHEPAAEFFLVLWHTGMRFNELFHLPINSMFKGKAPDSLHEELTRHNINYHGYLVLESQGVYDDHRREKDHSIARKPLKSTKKISPKNSRTIPIASKEVWNILARRYKEQKKEYDKGTFGLNLSNYIFFQDLEWNKANLTIKGAYEVLKRKPKSYHCCRHSFATLTVGKTKSIFLARSITGHKSNAFERYLHVWEQMTLEAQKGQQEIEEIA